MKRILLFVLLLGAFCQTAHAQVACNQSVSIAVTAGTTGQLVAIRSGDTIVVCGFVISGDTASTTAQFQYGTGTTCGTGTINLTGAMRMAANGSITYGNGVGVIFQGAKSNAICLAAVTGAVSGILTFGVIS